ncbi:NrsF family protein [Phenylobacterium sp.]|uniref:NrsF family protein n=1 Tax=Phenylobacterium sp. TaxID=1871053 RepID=UPI0035AE7482
MNTDDLISRLSADTARTPPNAALGRLLMAICLGAAAALVALLVVLGPRPDLAQAMGEGSFWMKAGYTGALSLAALLTLMRVARPGGSGGAAWIAVAALPVLVFALAALELASAAPAARHGLMMGHSWMLCPWRILGFAAPVFVGLIWAFRRLAPTRLRLAGLAAGLTAGAVGATVYGLACTEYAAAFLAIWYTLGMAAAGLLGALTGPRLLRW